MLLIDKFTLLTDRLSFSLRNPNAKYKIVELPNVPGIKSYYQLCCVGCYQSTILSNVGGAHFNCAICDREFHTKINNSKQFTPQICPDCVFEKSLCMMCGPLTGVKPLFLTNTPFSGISAECDACTKLYKTF